MVGSVVDEDGVVGGVVGGAVAGAAGNVVGGVLESSSKQILTKSDWRRSTYRNR